MYGTLTFFVIKQKLLQIPSYRHISEGEGDDKKQQQQEYQRADN